MSKLICMYEKTDRYELDYPGGPEQVICCDLVVVGGGGSGMSAAVRAAELGRNVVVVEKMDAVGGNSYLTGGLLSTTSRYQRERGFEDKTDHYIETAHKFHNYLLDPKIFTRYLKNSGTYLEWLVGKGFDIENNSRWAFDGAVMMLKNRTEENELDNPAYGPGWIGTTIIGLLEKAAKELGVQILTSTKVQSLIKNEDGSVIGIRADGPNASYTIRAKSTIVAAGNIGSNTEMLRRFLPRYFTSDNYFSHYSLSFLTGDGIAMAEEAGAEVGKSMSVALHALAHYPGRYSIQRLINEPLAVIVNKRGERFCCEDEADDAEYIADRQPEGRGFYLVDRPTLEEAFELVLQHVRFGDRAPTHEEFESDLLREQAEGKLAICERAEDLAGFIGCSKEALLAQIERVNAQVDAGKDDEFYKDSSHLRKIQTAPFYAIRLQRNFDVTMGGITINEHLQVLRPDGSVIRGLYAVGDNASGWMGEEYGPMFSSFCWACNSGYLAGEEAASAN